MQKTALLTRRPTLQLVWSQPSPCLARPRPEICRAVAATIADRFRGMWLPASVGPAGVVEILRQHVVEARGFDHPNDIEAIIAEAMCTIAEREAAARAAFRRPPRRRRPQAARGEQLLLPFEVAA